MFKKATREQLKLRMAISGVSGGGKTYSSLAIASHLGGKIAVLDTERGSASKYSHKYDFDVCELDNFHPKKYMEVIEEAGEAGYDVLIIDSLSHSWSGENGALELVDAAAKRSNSKNTFMAWGDITPLYRKMFDTILRSPCHIIATMRSKTEYVVENVNGKNLPRKVGMAPEVRQGFEYEFDIVGDMDLDNNMIITKSRAEDLSGKVINKPGKELATQIKNWLLDGVPRQEITKEPYSFWRSPQDAINWAMVELDAPEEEIKLLLDRTEPDKMGKRMIPFYQQVLAVKNGEV